MSICVRKIQQRCHHYRCLPNDKIQFTPTFLLSFFFWKKRKKGKGGKKRCVISVKEEEKLQWHYAEGVEWKEEKLCLLFDKKYSLRIQERVNKLSCRKKVWQFLLGEKNRERKWYRDIEEKKSCDKTASSKFLQISSIYRCLFHFHFTFSTSFHLQMLLTGGKIAMNHIRKLKKRKKMSVHFP